MAIQYKRILLKVSGEALSGPKGTGFDEETIASICAGIKAAHDLGAQIGIVVGGGNFWRGRSSGKMDRMDADKIGMLATVMNALAVKDALRQQGVDAVVMTSSFMPQVAECFTSDKAIAALRSPWLHALLERMRIERCYSAYYLPCRWRSVRLIFTLAEAKRTGSPMFGKLDWAGYYLLGGRLRRD